MKRRAAAGMLAALIALSAVYVPVYADYDIEGSTYQFTVTSDLKADIDESNNDTIVLTWPAVDTQGNVIHDLPNGNPLTADNQVNSNGNPKRGWTFPTSGMVISFPNWTPEGTVKPNNGYKGTDVQILKGIVDTPTKYPLVIKDTKTGDVVKNAYLDPTPVTDTYATGYLIQYRKSGETEWKEDQIFSNMMHGKKLSRPGSLNGDVDCDGNVTASDSLLLMQRVLQESTPISEQGLINAQVLDGTIDSSFAADILQHVLKEDYRADFYVQSAAADDKQNTFFLYDQITAPLKDTLEPETLYDIRVLAIDAQKDAKGANPYKIFETSITTPSDKVLTQAFPSVEGGGKFSQGGRGTETQQGDVYYVTNLTDSVSNPQPGSLRYGLKRLDRADKNSTYPRTIVFKVGGVIHVDDTVQKSQRNWDIGSNTTIAGQTAPGTGITLSGGTVKFNGENIITRYIHVRLGSGYDLDGSNATGENIVIDHCTFSHGVDETFSAKEIINSSFQYNIVESGLSMVDKDGVMNSDGELGADSAQHGMGSIINGYNMSYTHNIWAHNGTRNPRFEGSFTYKGTNYDNKLDFSNNVVYNWGHGAGYGGDRGSGDVNFEGNTYKPGPNTLEKVKDRFMSCDGTSSYRNEYYLNDNVLVGNDAVTADNALGFINIGQYDTQAKTKFAMKNVYTADSAAEAYKKVLESAGASLYRDALDNRLVYQIDNGTGNFVNDETESGGFETRTFTSTIADTDNDGLPDTWEDAHSLNKNDPSDSTRIIKDEASRYNGYTNLEVYLNDLTGEWGTKGDLYVTNNTNTNAAKAVKITGLKDSSGKAIDISVNADLQTGAKYTLTCDDASKSGFDVYFNNKVVAHGTNGSATFNAPTALGNYSLMVKSLGDESQAHPTEIFSDRVRVTVYTANDTFDGFTSAELGVTMAKGADFYDKSANSLITEGNGLFTKTSHGSTREQGTHFIYKPVTGDVTMTAKIYNLEKIRYFQFSGIMIASAPDINGEMYGTGMNYLKDEDFDARAGVNGKRFEGRNIVPLIKPATAVRAQTLSKYLGIPQARANSTTAIGGSDGGWVRIAKKGTTVTLSGSVDGNEWYELYTTETTLPDTCYIGFATSSAQDGEDMIQYNKSLFTDISITQ